MVKQKTGTKTIRVKKTSGKKTSKELKTVTKTRKPIKRAVKVTKEPQVKRLYRSGEERILGGVCGGIAEYFNFDPTLIRLLWVIASFFWGFGILAYIVSWIIIPKNPKHKWC